MTITPLDLDREDLRPFAAPTDTVPDTDHLFTDTSRHIVQTPPERNDYKKRAGSSDGARTYDTMAV